VLRGIIYNCLYVDDSCDVAGRGVSIKLLGSIDLVQGKLKGKGRRKFFEAIMCFTLNEYQLTKTLLAYLVMNFVQYWCRVILTDE